MEHTGDGDINCSCGTWNGFQRPEKRLKELEIRGRMETIWTTTL